MNLIINNSIRGVVSNEDTLWSVLEENISNSKGVDFDSLKIPIKEKLDELKPELIIQNANLGNSSRF